MSGERKPPNDPNLLFKEKEKGGEGRSKAWWPMECSKEKNTFSPLPTPPPNNLFKPLIF
jgi:hypothetical protein